MLSRAKRRILDTTRVLSVSQTYVCGCRRATLVMSVYASLLAARRRILCFYGRTTILRFIAFYDRTLRTNSKQLP